LEAVLELLSIALSTASVPTPNLTSRGFLPSIPVVTFKMSDITVDKSEETLNRMKTAESIFLPISRETFEKLYLSPKHPSVVGDLRKKFGNPTPICLMGFLLAATPNSCILMGWRGAGGNGGAIL
jgi:hypothetical protein